ncbi:MAG: 1-acyl-sn-glycerol-3-phosphate acyltransferase [Clostridia bacterium]|nr:1-acyl-sn-glycerol-3-phosphate acyltransferase [Clostridia bacterium]
MKQQTSERALARIERKERFYKRAHALLAKLVLKLFRIRVYHAEREPAEENYLLCANHTAAMDPVVISAALCKQQPHFMAKKELFHIPLVRGLVRMFGAFPVDRAGDVGAIRTTMELLQNGKCVGMFPQGTRCPGKNPAETADKLKNGAGMLCVRTQVTVLPVCIRAKGNKLRLFGGADILVGEPVRFDTFGVGEPGHAEYVRVTQEIFSRICALYNEESGEQHGA